jgi:hypothetical protein
LAIVLIHGEDSKEASEDSEEEELKDSEERCGSPINIYGLI